MVLTHPPLAHLVVQDSFFQPYLPLQQIDLLKTRSYLVGTTNSIFQQQRDCHIDVLVNVRPRAPLLDPERRCLSRHHSQVPAGDRVPANDFCPAD